MNRTATWTLAAASVGLFIACEMQPDWSDVARQIEENKKTTTTGTNTTTATTGPASGTTGTTDSAATTGPTGSITSGKNMR